MRRSLHIGHTTPFLSLKPFSSHAGRGRGYPAGDVPAVKPDNDEDDVTFDAKPAIGHGRGMPIQSGTPFSASMGRGFGITPTTRDTAEVTIRNDLKLGIGYGAGRGKVLVPAERLVGEAKVENRHVRVKPVEEKEKEKTPKLSREDAVKKALGILSKGDGVGVGVGVGEGERIGERRMDDGGGRGGRGGRGFRGRGRGERGTWAGGRGRGGRDFRDKEEDHGAGLYLGDEADGEKLAKRLGPEKMDMLVESFEEIGGRVLPSPMEDAYIDALHTNMMIECEPEWLMEEFGMNPDVDDTPPIALRDALEKMKPFLMAYENIQSHEEWEKVIEETMKTVPLMKEIVDHYSGPDRVTAKQQQKELQRVADTLPDKAHASVKRFTDRAILSLQSNPGWGFDKKCQFMDKLVWEAQQHYNG